MTAKNRVIFAAATAALAGGLAVGAPTVQADALAPAAAAHSATASRVSAAGAVTCSKWKSIRADHNSVGVKYMECDRKVGGKHQTSAALYIWDNKTDGKYARVNVATGYAHWYGFDQTWGRYYSWTSTRHHSPKLETGWHSGNDVEVLLKAIGH